MKEAYDFIKERVYDLLEIVPSDTITEKYVASAIRDYTQAMLNIEKLKEGRKEDV